ncbi:hypothetical protein B2J88_50740 [Rhodococcus sp. SRB_17]|nr:hypothetical protein [Rhodococcus sp. SRB_17]
MSSHATSEQLVAKIAQLTISDDAAMCQLLRATVLAHARQGRDIIEPALLGLLAIAGILEEHLTRLETSTQSCRAA